MMHSSLPVHPNDKHGQRKHRKMLRRLHKGSVNKTCLWYRNYVKRLNGGRAA